MTRARPPTASVIERNLFHMSTGSILPVIGLLVSHDFIFWAAVSAAGVAIAIELGRFSFHGANHWLLRYFGVLFKEEERRKVTGATYLLIGTVGAFLFFDKSVAIVALLFLSLGDPAAAMVGSRYGRLKVAGKTVEGSLTFLAVSLLVGGIFALAGQVDAYWPLVVGAAVAAAAELLPLPVDDNLVLPLIGGAVMAALL